MGAIIFSRLELLSALSEHAGYKAGVALNERLLRRHLPDHEDYLVGPRDQIIRVRAEKLDAMAAQLLFVLGNTPRPDAILVPGQDFMRRHMRDPEMMALFGRVTDIFKDIVDSHTGPGPIDVTPLLIRARELGLDAELLALEFVNDLALKIHQSPFSSFRRIEWIDTVQLKDLFCSENLTTQYGEFLDQRFIDYLAQNFDDIDRMNWRQFEGLASEFFHRQGLDVRLSQGRNDGGVDIRVWRPEQSGSTPPALLIQCKRQKAAVGKVVVKALYADILDERAESGLVVTTCALSPGAEKVCIARAYPVAQANRRTLKAWLEQMRTPGTGVFLGI